MVDNLQGNSPDARTATGELKDQTPTTTPTTETSPATTTATTPTTTEAAPPAGDKSLLNEDAPAGAPEAYAEFKAPEGMTLDAAALEKATPVFKELGLSQDQAQRLVDLYAQQTKTIAEKPYQDYQDTRKAWQTQVKADFGNNLPEVKSTIGRAIATLPPEVAKDFREAMDLTGAGDNPAFVKAFYAFSKSITEGRPVNGKGPAPVTEPGKQARPSPANALFPNLPSGAPQ